MGRREGNRQRYILRVRRILNRPCTELRPEGAAKFFSREQPLILDSSVRLSEADPG